MAAYQRIFAVQDVAEAHVRFERMIATAERVEQNAALMRRLRIPAANIPRASATLAQILRIYADWNRSLDELARVNAVRSVERIRYYLKVTAKRPDTRVSPHLRQLIISRPLRPLGRLSTGNVGVADEKWLDKAIDPNYPGAGEYWRAQEFGSTAQVGRTIRGYFFGPGYSNPLAPQQPPPSPLQPLFVPMSAQRQQYAALGFKGGAGTRGGVGGLGIIDKPIEARHFIARGAQAAYHRWLADINALQSQIDARLLRITPP